MHIKAALKKYYQNYPDLITKIGSKFQYKISFLNRTKRLRYFLDIPEDGADAFAKIFNNYFHLYDMFKKYPTTSNKILLIIDNEESKDKPLKKLINAINSKAQDKDKKKNKKIKEISFSKIFNCYYILDNLYLLPILKNSDDKKEFEIEDLHTISTLTTLIKGKPFKKYKNNKEIENPQEGSTCSKNDFATYVINHYESLDLSKFIPLLNEITQILKHNVIK